MSNNTDFELPQSPRAPRKGLATPLSGTSTFPNSTPASLPKGALDPQQEKEDAPGKLDSGTGDDLGEPSYSQEELLRVFDEIIFSGEYKEEYKIRGRVPVEFRTRTAEEMNGIQKFVDSSGYNLISTVESMKSILNLQYALCKYKGTDLSGLKEPEKASFIKKLPGPIVGMLILLLGRFDNKVNQACREGNLNF